MDKKTLLFDEEEIQVGDKPKWTVNEDFANDYERKQRRQTLDNMKNRFTERELASGEDSESSSSDCEDSEGDMIDENFQNKFVTLINDIRTNNPRLKEVNAAFDEKDYAMPEDKGKETKFGLKDQIRKEVMDKMDGKDSEDEEEGVFKKLGGRTQADDER